MTRTAHFRSSACNTSNWQVAALALGVLAACSQVRGQSPPQVSTWYDQLTPRFDLVDVYGQVYGNGRTTVWFEWGLTSSYGNVTPVGTYYDPYAQEIHAVLLGLAPGTSYFFRAAASNGYGTSYGQGMWFTTYPAPVVTTSPATDVNWHGATFNGAVDPRGQQTSAGWEYGTTTNYGSHTSSVDVGSGHGQVTIPPFYLAVATPGTTVHFRARADSQVGCSAFGSDQSFTAPLPRLSIRSGRGYWDTASTTITYAWNAAGTNSFILLQSADPAAPMSTWVRIATNQSNSGTFPVPQVGTGAPKFYRLKVE